MTVPVSTASATSELLRDSHPKRIIASAFEEPNDVKPDEILGRHYRSRRTGGRFRVRHRETRSGKRRRRRRGRTRRAEQRRHQCRGLGTTDAT